MSEAIQVMTAAVALAGRGVPFVIATVVRVQGSTPRNPGARMIWAPGVPDEELAAAAHVGLEGAVLGTVGGGQFEMLALDDARRYFRERRSGVERYVLGAEADQCCGGVMEVFFEYCGARRRVVLFGAGHVAAELAALLARAGGGGGVETVVVDDRPEWNTAERFPGARRVGAWDDGIRLAHERPAETLACVMTCSHDTDYQLLRRLLVEPPSFVGLIGSRSKRACLFGRLVASGLSDEVVQRVHCPIGVGDTGKEPAMVAISMAAQLLVEVKKMDRAPHRPVSGPSPSGTSLG
ncbi:MAG: XdhC family protein [Phycisphaeraceae bacterium]|nr:XdhC family protein [Phycisphaeraceae bacterium]